MTAVDPRTGRTALVVGGAGGIGAAVCRRLADRGMDVVVADRDGAGAGRLAGEIDGRALVLDVTDPAVVEVLADGEAPSVVVHCVGGAPRRPAAEYDEELWSRTLDLNLMGFVRVAVGVRSAAVRAGRPATIVHIGSSLSGGPAPDLAHFGAAKAACAAVVRTLAHEWASDGIRVNTVVPGLVLTPATRPALEAGVVSAGDVPLGRIGRPEDVAGAVDYLTGPDGTWITGAALVVDGGRTVAG